MADALHLERIQLIQLKRQQCSNLIRSRKRKLKELYVLATTIDGIPNVEIDPDAPPGNAGEQNFLEDADILQKRHLNELNIPARPRTRIDASRPAIPDGPSPTIENVPNTASKPTVNDEANVANQVPPVGRHAGPAEAQSGAVSIERPMINETPVPVPAPATTESAARIHAQAPKSQFDVEKIGKPGGRPCPRPSSPNDAQTPAGSRLPEEKDESSSVKTEAAPEPRLTEPGAVVQQSTRASSDMAVVFVQPNQNGTVSKRKSSAAFEVDEPFLPAPEQDVARLADALSSPGSTAQTATTPAVLDTSTNTSPDHDSMQDIDRAENKTEDGKSQTARIPTPQHDVDRNGLESSKEVEAQLLRDSAEAAKAQSKSTDNATESLSKPNTPQECTGSICNETQAQESELASLTAQETGPSVLETPSTLKVNEGGSGVEEGQDGNNFDDKLDGYKNTIMSDSPVEHKSKSDQSDDTQAANGVAITEMPTESTQKQNAEPEPKASPSVPQQAERAVTRVSTGAIRQKSVSEILTGAPPEPLPASRSTDPESLAPITPNSQSPRPRARSLIEKAKSKGKSKMSTVVFGKQARKTSDKPKALVTNHAGPDKMLNDDYFTPLFVQNFSNGTKWMKPLDQILNSAHKTVSTADAYTQILDAQACKVLRRVYNLQQHDKWSLRQLKRCPEPARPKSHWDLVLDEVKWMRTDFREERKWKMAAARRLVNACAEWVSLAGDPDEQKALQFNCVIPSSPPKLIWEAGDLRKPVQDVSMANVLDGGDEDNHLTPDLIASADIDSPMEHDEELHDNILDTVAPSAIFALEDDEVVFGLHHSPNTDRLLAELPLYGSPLKVPESDFNAPKQDPDAHWRREALPISKYVDGRMDLLPSEPPRKRSRYQYIQEDEDEVEVLYGQQVNQPPRLEPENPDVALFRLENKSIRDRLHAGHQFRPPNEHSMPYQTFYESRSCSQWTVNEDDELKALVREYSYNWSLISSMLSTTSIFASAAERRTPWECFERWVMLEGLPHDMQKTQYFKLWQNRIETAQQAIRQQHQDALARQAQQQQQNGANGANGPVTPISRRRMSLPVKVERRRNQKHLTMIDAMRKLAKKRETAAQKQQHAAGLAAMRKAQEQPQPRPGPTKTPREYSIMRWERDQAMAERLAERMAQQQQRAEAQRRVRPTGDSSSNNANPQTQAAMQARVQQGQAAQMTATQNAQMSQNAAQIGASHPLANMARANMPNQMAVNGQARPRMPVQGAANGNGAQGHIAGALVPPIQMNGNGQVQMPVVNGQARMSVPTQPDMNLVIQAQRISEQQRQAVQLRQHQQHGQHGLQQSNATLQNSPPAMRAAMANGVNQKNYMNNAQAMMAAFNNANGSGMSTPPASGLNMPVGQSGSPRPPTSMPQQQQQQHQQQQQVHQTYVHQLQTIENQIRISNPNTPQDMIREMARNLLQNRHAQNAMNAAAGGHGQTANVNGPHHYAQLMRAQQQAQQAAVAAQTQAQQGAAQHQRNSSGGSATPPVPSIPK